MLEDQNENLKELSQFINDSSNSNIPENLKDALIGFISQYNRLKNSGYSQTVKKVGECVGKFITNLKNNQGIVDLNMVTLLTKDLENISMPMHPQTEKALSALFKLIAIAVVFAVCSSLLGFSAGAGLTAVFTICFLLLTAGMSDSSKNWNSFSFFNKATNTIVNASNEIINKSSPINNTN